MRPIPTAITTVVVSTMLAATMLVASAPPASAHHALEASTPDAGAQLDVAPARIALELTFEVRADGAVVDVVGADDATWTVGAAQVDGVHVSIDVDPTIGDGRFEVRWSVVSFDGAPVQGTVPFTIGEAGAAAPLDVVIDAGAASWIRVAILVVLGVLLALVLRGLLVTYGRRRGAVSDRRGPVRRRPSWGDRST